MEKLLTAFVLASGIMAGVRLWQVHKLVRSLEVHKRNMGTTIDRKGPNISTER
jgi:hypothetical protein